MLICFSHRKRFFKRFRNEAPSGRGHSFESDNVSIRVQPVTVGLRFFRHPTPALSQRALRFRLSRLIGTEIRGFRVPCIRPNRRVRSALSTGWASSVSGELADPELASLPFGLSLSVSLAHYKVTMVTSIHLC